MAHCIKEVGTKVVEVGLTLGKRKERLRAAQDRRASASLGDQLSGVRSIRLIPDPCWRNEPRFG